MSEQERKPFGWWLARLRNRRSLSQTQLAVRAGFDHSYVSRLESGH
jgi:transcriptional regulator with XRE-family HTH domain